MKKDWPRISVRHRKGKADDYCIYAGKRGKKVVRLFRRSLEEAEKLAADLRERKERLGDLAIHLTLHQAVQAATAFEILQGESIVQAAQEFIERKKSAIIVDAAAKVITASRLAEAQIEDMRHQELRPITFITYQRRLQPFLREFGGCSLDTITTAEIEKWWKESDRRFNSPETRRKELQAVDQFFRFAVKRQIIEKNPVDPISRIKVTRKMPEYMSAENVDTLLHGAIIFMPESVHAMAIGFFAGVRPTELGLLTWKNIGLSNGLITITPDIAKTRRVRHVTISPALRNWLELGSPSPELVVPEALFRRKRLALCRLLNIEWTNDCMRHTFATYHLALWENPQKTALELGHTQGLEMLFQHYRGLTTKDDAKKFWQIRPRAEKAAQVKGLLEKAVMESQTRELPGQEEAHEEEAVSAPESVVEPEREELAPAGVSA